MSAITDILSGERGVAGVQQLVCADSILPIVRTMLAQPDALGACHLRRAKFKPGRKVTAYYDVEIDAGFPPQRTSSTVRPVTVTWTWPGAPQKLATDAGALGREIEARGLAAPFTQLLRTEQDGAIHVQVAPLDPLYPQLARLSDPAYAGKVLHDYTTAESQWMVTPVRYRPRQRHVLRFDACDAAWASGRDGGQHPSSPQKTLFAKLYRDDTPKTFCEFSHQLADWFAHAPTAETVGTTLLRPLAYLPAETTIVYAQAAGEPLAEELGSLSRGLNRSLARKLRQTGAALRTLHQAPAPLVRSLPPLDMEDELSGIARTCEHIQLLLPETWHSIHALLTQAADTYAALPQEAPTFVHGDFKADHVLAAGDRLTLIDFDSCALADPAFDVGKFLADLAWWFGGVESAALAEAIQAFLTGYGLPATHPRLQRARVWQALIGIKIIAHRVRIFEPQWSDRIAATVQTCVTRYGTEG